MVYDKLFSFSEAAFLRMAASVVATQLPSSYHDLLSQVDRSVQQIIYLSYCANPSDADQLLYLGSITFVKSLVNSWGVVVPGFNHICEISC